VTVGHVMELVAVHAARLRDGGSSCFVLCWCICARWVEGILVSKLVRSRVPKFRRRFYCGSRHVECTMQRNVWQIFVTFQKSKYESYLANVAEQIWARFDQIWLLFEINVKFWSCWDTLLYSTTTVQ
jgi:hypothetical protein